MLATSLPICCQIINKDNLSNIINIMSSPEISDEDKSNFQNIINNANNENMLKDISNLPDSILQILKYQ